MILPALAWRLVRGQRARATLVVACIALGVCARVGIGSFQGQFERALAREARNLLGGDVEVAANRALTADERAAVLAALPAGSRAQDVASLTTMATAAGAARLVELRVVDPAYPPAGSASAHGDGVDAGRPFARLAEEPPVAYVQPELLAQTGARVGDALRLGAATLTIAGTIGETAGIGTTVFAGGPKALIGERTFALAGLDGRGARVRHALLVALPDPTAAADVAKRVAEAVHALRDVEEESASGAAPRVRTAAEAQDQAARVFDRFADFLRLVALLAVMLAAVGVAAVARGFVAEQLESVAVLQVLGATARRVAALYALVALGVGLVGGALGAALGAVAQAIVAAVAMRAFADVLPVKLEVGVDWPACAWGVALGCLVATWAAATPILAVAGVRPLPVLRGQATGLPRTPLAWLVTIAGIAALVGVARLETRSWVLGPGFVAVNLAGGALIALAARAGAPLLARVAGLLPRAVGARHGLAVLARGAADAGAATAAIGLATSLALSIAIHGASLRADFSPGGDNALPSLFCIDIQDDQVDAFRALAADAGAPGERDAPMVVARWRRHQAAPDGHGATREDERARFFREREQRLSWRDRLGPDERLVAGTWMDTAPGPATGEDRRPVELSLETRFADRVGARLGDTMVFDLQGVEIVGTVTSLRAVRFTSFRPNFFILVSPHALAGAPRTWVASIPDVGPDAKARVQLRLAAELPNVTAIDIAQVARQVRTVVDRVGLATRVLAGFALAAGLVVLIGVAMASARGRLRDAALLATLGATRWTLAASLACEYGAIGLLAALGGAALAIGSSWALFGRVLDLPLAVPRAQVALVAAGVVVACAVTGVVACRRVFAVRPLAVLRED